MTTTKPRPKRSDPEIVRAAAEALAQSVLDWCQDNSQREDVIRDLEKALRHGTGDGYETARRLDNLGWTPDESLVDVLGGASFYFSTLVRNAEQEWTQESGITPPDVGSTVLCNVRPPSPGTGVVVKNRPEGKSEVRYPHQPEGSAYVIEWERLEVQP